MSKRLIQIWLTDLSVESQLPPDCCWVLRWKKKSIYVQMDQVDHVKLIDTGVSMEDHHYTNGQQSL